VYSVDRAVHTRLPTTDRLNMAHKHNAASWINMHIGMEDREQGLMGKLFGSNDAHMTCYKGLMC